MEYIKPWLTNHLNEILLTSGTIASVSSISLITVHEWLSVILQITGLVSFSIVFLLNYEKAWCKLLGLLSKVKKVFKKKI